MGLKEKLTQNGSALTYTGGIYPETYIIPTNPLATSPNQGGISLHANPLSSTTAAPGASLAGTNTVQYAAVNAAFQSYNDGVPTNVIPIPGGNPGADLDLEGSIPPTNAHGNPALLQFFNPQALPYDQNLPT